MDRHSAALRKLCNCLRGLPPVDVEWTSLIGLANQTLTTPALIDFVDQFASMLPVDVCTYIREIYQRNVMRNDRLLDQLEEAVVAMNDQDVTPMLLKGAATLIGASDHRRGVRLMCDLDIMVMPDETERALNALCTIGYQINERTSPESKRWYVELSRSRDVGNIDLQRPGPEFAYVNRDPEDVLSDCLSVRLGRARAYVPTPTCRALMLIIHDQFQDLGYWLGDLDLRHLLELRDLSCTAGGIDWNELTSHISGGLVRNALETQLLALAELLGVDIPRPLRSRLIPRLQLMRQLMQARYPVTRKPFLAMTILDLRNYRRQATTSSAPPRGLWSVPRASTLGYLAKATTAIRAGKV